MSTWRIFSDHRNDYRWEITDQQLQTEENCDVVPEDTRRLPSMADLLLIGKSISYLIARVMRVLIIFFLIFCKLTSVLCFIIWGNLGSSKLLDNEGSNVENPPMFRTGLGKSVDLKHSAIAKARSVLGEIDGSFTDTCRFFLEYLLYFWS